MKRLWLFLLLLVAAPAFAQTSVTGRWGVGAFVTRPAACGSGDTWTDTDDANSYKCFPNGTWNTISGGGGGTPGGVNGDVQLNISGTFGPVSKFNYNSTANALTMPFNVVFAGPNPYIDITAPPYNARSVTVTTTANCIASTNPVSVTNGANFINGDGITLTGCGAANPMVNPASGPTVTPSVSSAPTNTGYTVASVTGSTTYQYEYAAIDKNGGVTAASPLTIITNGQASLGQQTATVSTWTRSNNVTTYNTSASNPLATNAEICLTSSGDPGCMQVASTPSATQFTVQTGSDTRSGAAASGSGGTANFYLSNHMVATAVTGAFAYCWYGGAGVSTSFLGESRPGELSFDDYGTTFSAPPASSPCPAAPPGSATNDDLTTTISSGGGTNSLTLATGPSNTNGTATAKYDAAPAILSAATTAAQGGAGSNTGTLYIPCIGNGGGFTVNSYLDLSTLNRLHVLQAGALTLNRTLALGQFLTWDGLPGCSSQTTSFAKVLTATITVGAAWPGIYEVAGSGSSTVYFSRIQLGIPNQGLGFVAGSNSGFFTTFDGMNCAIGSGGNNYTGMCMVTYGNAQFRANNLDVTSSTPAGLYSTLTPAIFARNDIANTVPPTAWTFDNTIFVHQGFAAVASPAVGGAQFYTFKGGYSQGMIMPNITIEMGNENATIHDIGFVPDTTSAPIVTNIGTTQLTADFQEMSAASVVQTSGSPMLLHLQSTSIAALAQSGGFSQEAGNTIAGQAPWNTRNLTVYPFYNFNEQVLFTGGHSAYIPLAAPSNAAVAVSAGGSVSVGAHNYTVIGASIDGGWSYQSTAQVCTTTSGNQTCTLTWNALPGAVSYVPIRDGVAITACEATTALSCVDSTGVVDGSLRPGAQAGGGLVSITPAGLFGPQVVFADPISSNNVSHKNILIPPTDMASNATWTLPPFSGRLCAFDSYCDVLEIAAPANPASGFERWYANSSTHNFSCLTSSGGNCSPGGGGGPTLQTNSVNNSAQNLLNLINSTTNATGLVITDTNTSGGIVQAEISGTVNLASGGCAGSSATTCFNNISLMTTLGDLLYGGAGGAETRLQGPGVGTNLVYVLEDIPSGGSATAEQWGILGVPVPATQTGSFTFSGSGSAGTLGQSDQLDDILANPSAPATYTIPATGSLNFANNPAWSVFNENASNTITFSSSSTIVGDTVALPLWQSRITQQAGSSSYVIRSYPSMAAWGSTCTTKALQWSTTSGILCAQLPLTTGVTGSLPIANGGTNATTQQGALNNIAPSAIRAGDIMYFNGTNWTNLGGNNSGTQFLQETSAGVPSWSSGTTTTPLSSITAATGSNTTANANFPQTWNWAQTTAAQFGFTIGETAAKTGAGGGSLLVQTQAGSTGTPLKVINSLTGSQTLSALSVTPTWNTTGVVDAGILENVTNTASGAASLLLDLQVGGTSEFSVDKGGNIIGTSLNSAITATTQTGGDNSTKLATTAYVDAHFIANGTAAMGTSAISSGTCATVVTVSATGTATTDVISYTPNTDPTAVTGYAPSANGSLYVWAYPTTNNVNFKVCNNTAASITPSALTFNWKVTR